jgi:hypothetical protein
MVDCINIINFYCQMQMRKFIACDNYHDFQHPVKCFSFLAWLKTYNEKQEMVTLEFKTTKFQDNTNRSCQF